MQAGDGAGGFAGAGIDHVDRVSVRNVEAVRLGVDVHVIPPASAADFPARDDVIGLLCRGWGGEEGNAADQSNGKGQSGKTDIAEMCHRILLGSLATGIFAGERIFAHACANARTGMGFAASSAGGVRLQRRLNTATRFTGLDWRYRMAKPAGICILTLPRAAVAPLPDAAIA